MTEQLDTKRRSRGSWFAWIAVTVLLVYVLSIGPAVHVFVKTGFGRWYVLNGCAPLRQLARFGAPGRLLERYLNVWLPKGAGVARQDSRSGIVLTYRRDGALYILKP